jgi:hypothetical protein
MAALQKVNSHHTEPHLSFSKELCTLEVGKVGIWLPGKYSKLNIRTPGPRIYLKQLAEDCLTVGANPADRTTFKTAVDSLNRWEK